MGPGSSEIRISGTILIPGSAALVKALLRSTGICLMPGSVESGLEVRSNRVRLDLESKEGSLS
jgi:hypothetical protein